jgi:hypothetical protein
MIINRLQVGSGGLLPKKGLFTRLFHLAGCVAGNAQATAFI